MKIVIGLGNPGAEYEKTRHNAGFLFVDILASDWGAGDFREGFGGLLSEARFRNERVIIFKPQTYMNLSGQAVSRLVAFYKCDPKHDILVVFDDMSMEF